MLSCFILLLTLIFPSFSADGATSNTYIPTPDDVNYLVSATITPRNTDGVSGTPVSPAPEGAAYINIDSKTREKIVASVESGAAVLYVASLYIYIFPPCFSFLSTL